MGRVSDHLTALVDDCTWFLIFALLLGSRQLGNLRKIDDLCHTDDLRVRVFSPQSVKKDSSRNVTTTFDLVNSESRHLGLLILTPRPRRRSYLIGKLNYYCSSFDCFQSERHAISGDIHPNPGPTLEQNFRQETKPTRKPKLSCLGVWLIRDESVGCFV